MNHKLIIAAAGAGKTTYIVNKALQISDKNVLITTFTIANAEEIQKKFYELNNGIPNNVTILTWFSFLLKHGIKPYLSYFEECKICGIEMKGGYSTKYTSSTSLYYFLNKNNKIYSDKIAHFAYKINKLSSGLIIERINKIFSYIFIDEIQDLVGYDLEFIKDLLCSEVIIEMVGDIRQFTYSTCSCKKNEQYSGKIKEFINKEYNNKRKYIKKVQIDEESLNFSYRNNPKICEKANKIYPNYPACISKNNEITGHDGIFFVAKKNLEHYLKTFAPVQLRYDRKNKNINKNYPVYNFGESKGLSFDRVIIFPTDKMMNWLISETPIDELSIKAKLYVAITRAKYSVAIYCEKSNYEVNGITYYIP